MNIEFKKIYTISNFISLFRILLVVPIFYFISNLEQIMGARPILLGLYLLVYLSDIADGYFARRFNQVSELGKIIDPLADKILAILVVSYLFYYDFLPKYYFFIIIFRDALIFIGGIFVSKKIGKVLPSNYTGKLTVIFIGVVIILVTTGLDQSNVFFIFFYYGSIILSFISVLVYLLRGIQEVRKVSNENI